MYSFKGFNYNHIYFVGYETWDKLICASGEVCRNKNTISKQYIPNINMSMTSLQ